MTDAQQAIEAYINLTETPKAMELWDLIEQHCKPPDEEEESDQ